MAKWKPRALKTDEGLNIAERENEIRDKTEVTWLHMNFFSTKGKTKNEPCKYVGFVSTKKLGSVTDEQGRWDYTFVSFFLSPIYVGDIRTYMEPRRT